MSVANFIKSLREKGNLSQENLSQQANIELSAIQNLESNSYGKRDLLVLYKLSNFFKNAPSLYVEADARDLNTSDIDGALLYDLLESANYSDKQIGKLMKKASPWGNDKTRFIVAAAKYGVYLKIKQSATLKDLCTVFDSICSPTFYNSLFIPSIYSGKYNGYLSGLFKTWDGKIFALPKSIVAIHAEYKENSISIEHNKQPRMTPKKEQSQKHTSKESTPVKSIEKQPEPTFDPNSPLGQAYLKLIRKAGHGAVPKNTSPKESPETIANIDAEFSDE